MIIDYSFMINLMKLCYLPCHPPHHRDSDSSYKWSWSSGSLASHHHHVQAFSQQDWGGPASAPPSCLTQVGNGRHTSLDMLVLATITSLVPESHRTGALHLGLGLKLRTGLQMSLAPAYSTWSYSVNFTWCACIFELSTPQHSNTDDKLAVNKNSDRQKIIKVRILPHLSELLL